MSIFPTHCSWFENTGKILKTKDGREISVINFNHQDDDAIMNSWAKHFRNHYCSEEELDRTSKVYGITRSEYLMNYKLPSKKPLGSATRSGDFSEILVADYLEFLMDYEVSRDRYDQKQNPDSSTQGSDMVGFKFSKTSIFNDELMTCEVKATLRSRTKKSKTLQDVIQDSEKDSFRLPLTLNAMYQRSVQKCEVEKTKKILRFIDSVGNPYKKVSGAVLVYSENCWTDDLVTDSDSTHSNPNTFFLVFKGINLMDLAHKLYEKTHASA